MHVFLTGATGHIGKAVTSTLLSHGHTVLALIRSDSSEQAYRSHFPNERTVQVTKGTTAEHDNLTRLTSTVDAVIHLANNTDPNISRDQAALMDEETIRAMAEGLGRASSKHKAFAIASGTGFTLPEDTSQPGEGKNRMRLESDVPAGGPLLRRLRDVPDLLFRRGEEDGFNGIAVRISPTAHGKRDAGFVAQMIQAARKNGTSLYIGNGENRWSAVHVLDVAELFVLAVETCPNRTILHGTGETDITFKSIAEAIGRGVRVPAKSETDGKVLEGHCGRLAGLIGLDIPVDNQETKRVTGWMPKYVGLIEGLDEDGYFDEAGSDA